MYRIAGALLIGFAGLVRAEGVQISAAEAQADIEYRLAAAAEAGDPVSDWALAHGFDLWLQFAERGAGAPIDPALLERVVEERDRLTARADAVLMDDPVMLKMRLPCYGEDRDEALCETRRARLAEIDGDNAATAMVLMTTAWSVGDNAGFAAAAASGAKATRYDSDYLTVYGSMRRRFGAIPDTAVPGMPLVVEGADRASSHAMGMYAGLALPPFQHFVQPCRESEGKLLEDCLAIARRMLADSSTLIEGAIGAALLAAVGTDADKRLVAEHRRESAWLQVQASTLFSAAQTTGASMQVYFDTFEREGEKAAFGALLQAHGLPRTPPQDWMTPRAWSTP